MKKNNITAFQKNILLMFKGTLLAQLTGTIGTIFLAKLYGSEAYGIFSIFISISSVLTILNTFQYDKSIVTTKIESENKNLMTALFLLTIFIASITFVGYYTYTYYTQTNLLKFSIIVSLYIGSILLSFNRIHESYFTFKKDFRPISKAKIITALLNIFFQFLLFYEYKINGLIYGNLISLFFICIYYFSKNKKHLVKIDFQLFKRSLITNQTFAQYLFPSVLVNNLAINLMPILIATFFSLKDSGVYFFSLKILAAPLFLISSSLSQVYYQKSAELLFNSKGKLFDLTKKLILSNLGIMFLFLVMINTFGIFLLELIFDDNWNNLRVFTLILSFLILAKSSFNPISSIIIVLNKNHIGLYFNIYLLMINLIAIFIGYTTSNILNTVIILSIFGGCGYIILLFYFLNELQQLKNKHD